MKKHYVIGYINGKEILYYCYTESFINAVKFINSTCGIQHDFYMKPPQKVPEQKELDL